MRSVTPEVLKRYDNPLFPRPDPPLCLFLTLLRATVCPVTQPFLAGKKKMLSLRTLIVLLVPLGTAGFSAGRTWTMSASSSSSSSIDSNRREFLSVGFAGALLGSPLVANAGYLNADKLPEVMAPDPSAVDRDTLKTGKVQDAIKTTKYYLAVVQEMEKQLKANPQLDLGPAIRKYFAFNDIRTALNTVNEALDEDTQRGTDRLIRNTIQDITELESANKLKAGVVRSDRKIVIMTGKLEKLDRAFTEFLAFFK